MKGYSSSLNASRPKPHHQMFLCHIKDTRRKVLVLLYTDAVGVFYSPSRLGWTYLRIFKNSLKLIWQPRSGVLGFRKWYIGQVGREFANGPGDLSSIPCRVIPKTLKMVLNTALLNTQCYTVRIKGKVEQSRERSNALPYTLV